MRDADSPVARWAHEVRRRLGASHASGGAEWPVVEELSAHLEDRHREWLARGLPEDEARRRTLEELEDGEELGRVLLRHTSDTAAPLPPPERGGRWWAGIGGDARYALRLLRRDRGFTTVALVTLTLGIGAVTAMFTLVNGLLIRPLPYPHPERLATVVAPGMILPRDLDRWRDGVRSLERFAGFDLAEEALSGEGPVRRLSVMMATDDLLPLLGAAPVRGRLWSADEVEAGDPRVVIISERLWQEVLHGRDPVDRPLVLDGIPHEVLGVLPDEFHNLGYGSDAWVPVSQRDVTGLQGVVRLRPGAKPEEVQAELEAVAERIEALPIAEEFGRMVRLQMQRDVFVGDARATLLLLLAASGCVLLLACANLANLLLSRAAGRGREMAIRHALGAGRRSLLRQLIVEHLLLATAGSGLGLWLAWAIVRVLVPILPPGFTRLPMETIRLDPTVLCATIVASMLAMLLAGLAPTLASMRAAAPMAIMARGTSTRTTRRRRETLIAAETAIAVILLATAVLLMRTWMTLRPASPGYDTRDRIVAMLRLSGDSSRNVEFVRRLISEVELSAPGVRAAASFEVPLSGRSAVGRVVAVDGRPLDTAPGARPPRLDANPVTPEFVDVLGVSIVRGRGIAATDVRGTPPVVVLNQAAARRFWPGLADPAGRRITADIIGGPIELLVVGVFEDVRTSGLSTTSRPQGLLSYYQSPWPWLRLIVHVPPGSRFDARMLREAVAGIDRDVPVEEITTLAAIASRAVSPARYQMTLMMGFGLLAVSLALIGCYGVLAYSVAQRTREFAVRMALGATPREIRRAVLRRAALLVVVGLAIGGGGAIALARLVRSGFYGVVPPDPMTLPLAGAALLAVSMLAAFLPARRAAAVDPVFALREE